MDSSYNIWNQRNVGSSMTPTTPGGSAYQTNIHRAKTKKWVEAKPQSYDGDDWGDGFDDHEPSDSQSPPRKPTGLRQPGQGLSPNLPLPSQPQSQPQPRPYQFSNPQAPSSGPSPAAMRPQGGPPPLHVHTQQPFGAVQHQPYPSAQQTPQSAGAIPSGPSSVYSRSDAAFTPASQTRQSPVVPQTGPIPARFPPRKSSKGQHDRPTLEDLAFQPKPGSQPGSSHATPQGPRSPVPSSNKPPPPADPAPVGESSRVRGNEYQIAGESSRIQEPLAPVPERKSEYGFDGVTFKARPDAPSEATRNPEPAVSALKLAEESGSPHDDSSSRRFSASPQLPNLARMSAFGEDLFSSYTQSSDPPPVPALPQHVESQPPAAITLSIPLESLKEEVKSAPIPQTAPEWAAGKRDASSHSAGEDRPFAEPPAAVYDTEDRVGGHAPPTVVDKVETAPPLDSKQPEPKSMSPGLTAETPSTPPIAPPKNQEQVLAAKRVGMDPGEVSPVSESGEEEMEGNLEGGASVDAEQHPTLPPLRTEEPAFQDRHVEEPANSPPPASATGTEMTPIAPLNPHRTEHLSDDDFVAPVLRGEGTMSTIASQSPVKESDRLREEIINSLSPVGASPAFLGPPRPATGESAASGEGAGRESTYLPSAYDEYWASNDPTDSPVAADASPENLGPHRQPEQLVTSPSPDPMAQASDRSPALRQPESQPQESHKRFSWEGGLERVNTNQDSDADVTLSAPEPESLAKTSPKMQVPQLAINQDDDTPSPASGQGVKINIPPPSSGTVSHQVSQASSVPRGLDKHELEPPSPVSVMTDRNSGTPEEPSRLSLAGNDLLTPAAASEKQSTSPMPPQTAVATPPGQPQAPIMTFKAILNLPTAADRIEKYNETRMQFINMDMGVSNFLAQLKASHPEHAHATQMFPPPLSRATHPAGNMSRLAPGGHASASHSTQSPLPPPTQQPYYQQYLNASSPNVSAATVARPPSQVPPNQMNLQGSTSDFKHSSNQMGAKGKEFLLAAGKAGKGLLHKGKNKLRGTGEKVFHY